MLFQTNGISHQHTCHYSPQQNGRVEIQQKHLLQITRALLFQASLPWKAILHATCLITRRFTIVVGWKTPYKVFYGKKPDYSTLKVFGSLCYCSNINPHKLKLEPRASKCIYQGNASNQKSSILLDIEQQNLFVSKDVLHYEFIFPYHEPKSIDLPEPLVKPAIILSTEAILVSDPSELTRTGRTITKLPGLMTMFAHQLVLLSVPIDKKLLQLSQPFLVKLIEVKYGEML